LVSEELWNEALEYIRSNSLLCSTLLTLQTMKLLQTALPSP
jgi:hypothetical protein